MPQVDFIFDFASPNAYVAHKLIPDIEARTGATFNYIPCLLGGIFKATGNQPPMVANANVPAKMAYDRLEFGRFLHQHSLTKFNMNPDFPINTIVLMRGATVASLESKEALMKYVDVVFHSMWEVPRNLNDPAAVAGMLTEEGYSPTEFLARTQQEEVKKALFTQTEAAVARGVFGIPTFFVGEEMFFGKDRLDQVEAEIVRQSK